jgi:hypothetical protein
MSNAFLKFSTGDCRGRGYIQKYRNFRRFWLFFDVLNGKVRADFAIKPPGRLNIHA